MTARRRDAMDQPTATTIADIIGPTALWSDVARFGSISANSRMDCFRVGGLVMEVTRDGEPATMRLLSWPAGTAAPQKVLGSMTVYKTAQARAMARAWQRHG